MGTNHTGLVFIGAGAELQVWLWWHWPPLQLDGTPQVIHSVYMLRSELKFHFLFPRCKSHIYICYDPFADDIWVYNQTLPILPGSSQLLKPLFWMSKPVLIIFYRKKRSEKAAENSQKLLPTKITEALIWTRLALSREYGQWNPPKALLNKLWTWKIWTGSKKDPQLLFRLHVLLGFYAFDVTGGDGG